MKETYATLSKIQLKIDLYGLSKFIGKRILNNNAEPIAMSVYPLKSKYNWKVKDNDNIQPIIVGISFKSLDNSIE